MKSIINYKTNVSYGAALLKSEKMLARERNVKARVKYLKKHIRSFRDRKFLEIGSHDGLFLKELQNAGAYVLGIEPSELAANYAVKNGIKTRKGLFEEIFPNIKEKFDAVFLFHTLEHMEDAHGNLKKIKSLLNPDGFIFIEVPNIESYRSKKYGGCWEYIYSEHLHYFSPESFTKILDKSGLKMEKIYYRDFDDLNMSIKQCLDRLIFYKFFKNQKAKHEIKNSGLDFKKMPTESTNKKNLKKNNYFLYPLRKILAYFVKILRRGDFILAAVKSRPLA